MAIKKKAISPRQKMINLMYVVLMAMLALNVSNDVLKGFKLVGDSLKRSSENAEVEVNAIYDNFAKLVEQNPEKGQAWFDKATDVKKKSDDFYKYVEQLKVAIAREADGKDGNPDSLINQEDLEAATQIMLAPGKGKGKELFDRINSYRNYIVGLIPDKNQAGIISANLTTAKSYKEWGHSMFEAMPAIAVITMLTKLQADVRQAESEAIHEFIANSFLGDVTVNNEIVRYISNEESPKNPNTTTNETKEKIIPSGSTVAADLMNVLYAGFDNPISVSANGINMDKITLTMTGGTLTSKGDGHYIARPAAVGQPVTFHVSGVLSGESFDMGTFTFKVRKLPDPTAYIPIGDDKFLGGRALGKGVLLGVSGIGAAIDDGLLDIPFTVLGFETTFFDKMGNAIPFKSNGSQFSQQQKDMFRQLAAGKRFYISHVKAVGPDNIQRELPQALEVIVR